MGWSIDEVQQAARLLFGSYLASAEDDKVVQLAERCQDLRTFFLSSEWGEG